jgi:5'-methylthioadenosine phosphorylase
MAEVQAEVKAEVKEELLGVIGGTSLLNSSYFAGLEQRVVPTDHGAVVLHFGRGFVFCQRHHADPSRPYTPPHLINFRAILTALHASGVRRVLSFGSTGSLKKEVGVGTVVVPDDFFNLFNQVSFYDDARAHIVAGIDPGFRQEVIDVLHARNTGDAPIPLHLGGTYVQTSGPRMETKAEIRVISSWGHIVAMTAAHEVVLACELGMKSALICMVDNYANGIVEKPLTMAEFKEGVKKNEKVVERVLDWMLERFAFDLAA